MSKDSSGRSRSSAGAVWCTTARPWRSCASRAIAVAAADGSTATTPNPRRARPPASSPRPLPTTSARLPAAARPRLFMAPATYSRRTSWKATALICRPSIVSGTRASSSMCRVLAIVFSLARKPVPSRIPLGNLTRGPQLMGHMSSPNLGSDLHERPRGSSLLGGGLERGQPLLDIGLHLGAAVEKHQQRPGHRLLAPHPRAAVAGGLQQVAVNDLEPRR